MRMQERCLLHCELIERRVIISDVPILLLEYVRAWVGADALFAQFLRVHIGISLAPAPHSYFVSPRPYTHPFLS